MQSHQIIIFLPSSSSLLLPSLSGTLVRVTGVECDGGADDGGGGRVILDRDGAGLDNSIGMLAQ